VTEGLKRDEAGEAVGKTSRPRAKGAQPRATTTRVLTVTGARLSITWQKKTVRSKDIIDTLEEALAKVRKEAS
jgi:hypothetical protein